MRARRSSSLLAAASLIALLASGTAARADEFDIFDEAAAGAAEAGGDFPAPEAPPETAAPAASRAEASLEAETSYSYRFGKSEQITGPSLASVDLSPAVELEIGRGLSLEAGCEARLRGFLAGGRAGTDASANSSSLRYTSGELGITRAALSFHRDSLVLRAGLLKLAAGSEPLVRPTAWFERYSEDPSAPGASSFLGIEAAFYSGEAKLGLTLLPRTGLASDGPLRGLFRETGEGSALELRASTALAGGTVSALGFAQAGLGALLPVAYGAGLELQLPLGKRVGLAAEGLASSGLGAWEPAAGGLARGAAPAREFFLDGLVSLKAVLLSSFELGLGYAYSGRGLDPAAWEAVTAPGELWRGADPYLKHRLLLSLSLPRVTESIGVMACAYASPVDGSARFFVDAWAQGPGIAALHLRAELWPFRESSAYGHAPLGAAFTAAVAFVARDGQ
jgi:hypothetical protein